MPAANKNYVCQYWPIVYMALDELGLDNQEMLLMTVGTIAAETGSFNITVREYISQYNTSPNGRMMGRYFDLYDHRKDLGNTGEPDGKLYRGGGAGGARMHHRYPHRQGNQRHHRR